MLQMTLGPYIQLGRAACGHFNSLDLKCCKSGYKKEPLELPTISIVIEIHKSAIFDRLKINIFCLEFMTRRRIRLKEKRRKRRKMWGLSFEKIGDNVIVQKPMTL
jgi:hypothetical protein